jgi:hypothetical protein
LLNNFT